MTYPSHPAASLFPMMPEDELEALAADMQTQGLIVPIVLHEGMVLDGRNRLAACDLAGVEPSFVEWHGVGDPTAWVVSQNLHRRHLSESQRAMIASRLAKLKPGDNQHRPIGLTSQSEASEMLNVSGRSVKRARVVQEHGIPELAVAVDEGDIALSRAADIARASAEEQPALIEQAPRPHVANNSGDNEWYTPPEYLDAARAVLGTIDMDPASSAVANQAVGAALFYAAEDDGLLQPWKGRLFMNPPYSRPLCGQFCARMVEQWRYGRVSEAIVLVNNATETTWFQAMLSASSAVCFPSGRVRFLRPDGTRGTPLQGQAFIYLGMDADKFIEAFRQFGTVLVTP